MFGMPHDPLIDYGWENLLLIISLMLFTIIVVLLGYLTRKLENAVFFTIIVSVSVFFVFFATYVF